MRTTLTIDDRIASALKDIARSSGKSFTAVVNDTLRAGLDARHRIQARSLGKVAPGIDLDKALAVADLLDDDELVNKL